MVVLAVSLVACGAADNPDASYSPAPGLECPSDDWWSEQGSLNPEAVGFATPEEAIAEGFTRWAEVPDSEVAVMDAFEGTAPAVGVLVSGGRRVVVAYPEASPAGGWLIVSATGCKGYEP